MDDIKHPEGQRNPAFLEQLAEAVHKEMSP